ncbi:glycoside hydrolase family 32 protein [Paenibacillus sp. CMAA1364]
MFIQQTKKNVRMDYRLNYHLMAEVGWMNDPNGFIQYNGEFHLFYQHYPYKTIWGPMHWGHAVSRDLVKWEYLPIALAPDEDFDRDGCFSGSAIERDGKLILMYTGHVVTGPDKELDYKQSQGIAAADDGVNFTKWESNPVISYDEIPEEISQKDFRDPKLFIRNGQYYIVLGSNDAKGNGLVLLYRSDDLKQWTYVNVIASSDGRFGDNWECPDLFQIDDKDVLMLSPQRMPAQGESYCNLHSTMTIIGKLDLTTGLFHAEQYAPIDHGFDYYAPQTTEDDNGRRIVIAWMDMWESEMPTQQDHGWVGAMSLPREVLLKDGVIVYRPLKEIESYRTNAYNVNNLIINGIHDIDTHGDSYELQILVDVEQSLEFGLKLRTGTGKNGLEETVISYDMKTEMLRFNRDLSGIGPGGERKVYVPLKDGRLSLRIFVDKCSIEVFANEGEVVMTGRIYPGEESQGIKIYSEGPSQVISFEKWDIL